MRKIAAFIVYVFYRILYATWRFRIIEHAAFADLSAKEKPLILAHWHGDELALLPLVRKYKLCTMTSTSKDGELINYVIHKLGGNTTRGSSTRGGIGGLKGLIRLIRLGHKTSLAVDGPKGPIYVPKPGVFELSRLGHAYIAPVAAVASRTHIFSKAWNKAFLPLPFSKVIAYVGAPLDPIKDEDEIRSEASIQNLTIAINAARQEASKLIATT